MVVSVVEGFMGVGVVGALGIIRATRGWTWLCRGVDIQVLQKVDEELLLVLLLMLLELLLVLLVGKSFSTLIDAVLPHGCIHGRDYFRHLGDHSRKGRDFSCYCL